MMSHSLFPHFTHAPRMTMLPSRCVCRSLLRRKVGSGRPVPTTRVAGHSHGWDPLPAHLQVGRGLWSGVLPSTVTPCHFAECGILFYCGLSGVSLANSGRSFSSITLWIFMLTIRNTPVSEGCSSLSI